jgi:EAL domain-containing protein (putative c-di-GMP-specific phosphodiesterase class I)
MLGQNLDKDVVAEGIEQVADLFLLDAQKCYKYQGYLFSQPIELSALATMLKKDKILTTLIA